MGVKNGEFKVFYYSGQIQESESYKKGLKEGWFLATEGIGKGTSNSVLLKK